MLQYIAVVIVLSGLVLQWRTSRRRHVYGTGFPGDGRTFIFTVPARQPPHTASSTHAHLCHWCLRSMWCVSAGGMVANAIARTRTPVKCGWIC